MSMVDRKVLAPEFCGSQYTKPDRHSVLRHLPHGRDLYGSSVPASVRLLLVYLRFRCAGNAGGKAAAAGFKPYLDSPTNPHEEKSEREILEEMKKLGM